MKIVCLAFFASLLSACVDNRKPQDGFAMCASGKKNAKHVFLKSECREFDGQYLECQGGGGSSWQQVDLKDAGDGMCLRVEGRGGDTTYRWEKCK